MSAAPATLEDVIGPLQAAYTRAVMPGEQADAHQALLRDVLQRLDRSYAREVDFAGVARAAHTTLDALPASQGDPAQVFRQAVNAALGTLDPYSRYIDPKAHASERSESGGSFGGVGLQVEAGDGGVRVLSPMPNTPAARAGLQSGDLIVRIDDQPLQGVALAEAIARMRGEPGTPVTVTVRRQRTGSDFTVALTREAIQRQLLRWSMADGVLVLRLGSFSGPVGAAIESAIDEATASAIPRGVVLDMRGNPGGLVREAVRTADTFLSTGDIVSLRPRAPRQPRLWLADGEERLPGVPMVVLLDRRSASASELVAAALQENGRALVMGQRSVGKGTVQATFGLGENQGAVKLTSATYHGPSGRSVQDVGVVPDIELAGAPRPPAERDNSAPKARLDPQRCVAIQKADDPDLACALAYVRAGGLDAFMAVLPSAAAASLP